MRELSLNILDIAQNSIKAEAKNITIDVFEDTFLNEITISILDDGKGMNEEMLKSVIDPFYTTRTTRRVGMGIPLFKMEAEMTGGSFSIDSTVNVGTSVKAIFKTDSVDFIPLGDVTSSIIMLVSMNTQCDFIYRYRVNENEFLFDTREIKEILGDVSLSEYDVTQWMKEYINENVKALYGGALDEES